MSMEFDAPPSQSRRIPSQCNRSYAGNGTRCIRTHGHPGDHCNRHAAWPEAEAAVPPSDGTTTPPPSAGIPRRIDTRRWVPAERAIQDAVDSVERMPGDSRLTDAVILLSKARDAVADYVDAQPIEPAVRGVKEITINRKRHLIAGESLTYRQIVEFANETGWFGPHSIAVHYSDSARVIGPGDVAEVVSGMRVAVTNIDGVPE